MDALCRIIGDNIRFKRRRRRMKQTDLAKLIYCTNETISNWENGKTYPTAFFLKKMSEVFECSIDDFFEGAE